MPTRSSAIRRNGRSTTSSALIGNATRKPARSREDLTGQSMRAKAAHAKQRMSADEFESMFTRAAISICLNCCLESAEEEDGGKRMRHARARTSNAETTISLEEAYHGSTRLIRLDGQTIRVTIPPGIADEQVLRIAGKGMDGINGGQKGDLFLIVKIAPHPEFHRKGKIFTATSPSDYTPRCWVEKRWSRP